MALPNTEEIIEKSVYLSIENILLREGYIPNIKLFDIENADINIARAAQNSYDAAVKAIQVSKGFAIELFGYTTNQDRGVKKVPRIVIDTEGFYPGSIGKDSTAQYKMNQTGTAYNKEFDGQKTSDLYFNIYLVANNVQQIRVLHGVLSESIPRWGYIPRYVDEDTPFELVSDGNIFIEYISYNQSDDEDRGVIEKVYRYMTPDVVENLVRIDNTNIAKIESIEYLDDKIIIE